jgi:predicted transcriptional regulator
MEKSRFSLRRRDRLCIIAEILNASNEVASKRDIMREANLSSLQFGLYIGALQDLGLIERRLKRKRFEYKTTEKGTRHLQIYNEVVRFLAPSISEHLLHAHSQVVFLAR